MQSQELQSTKAQYFPLPMKCYLILTSDNCHILPIGILCIKVQMLPCRRKVTIVETKRLMLFTEIITVYCENWAKHKCTVWEKCRVSEMMEIEHSNHCALWVN